MTVPHWQHDPQRGFFFVAETGERVYVLAGWHLLTRAILPDLRRKRAPAGTGCSPGRGAGARRARCRSCRAPIVWITTASGARLPVSVATLVARDGQTWGLAHFADCPQGRGWSAARGGACELD